VDTTGPNESIVYNVRLNDTLSGIAFKFGLEVEDILAVNPQIDEKSIIYVGQDILIPGPSLRSDS
jgi:LysM repeat protein